MRFEDGLYFAPGVRFIDLDLSAADLADKWWSRIEGFYLSPARTAADAGAGFASGVLAVSALDAMARIVVGSSQVRVRFKRFANENLPSFVADEAAEALWDQFRNGLVHEGRIKDGAEFTLESPVTLAQIDDVWRINPARLIDELTNAAESLLRDESVREAISMRIAEDFVKELPRRAV
ncbi:MAG: hypothetical protein JWL61_2308 [Gemmatimonadetes bacterium]|nr:hypothetical protein [Gemmatimonadota bacterium]